MPHCIIEHSASFDSELLLPLVFSGALKSELFEADGIDIKTRAIAYHSYSTGSKKSDFIHIVLKILSGRTLEQKKLLAKSVLLELQKHDFQNCSLTIEIMDIDQASYLKLIC